MPTITGKIPTSTIKTQNINVRINIELANPTFYICDEIDLLIGSELFYSLMRSTELKSITSCTTKHFLLELCNKVSIANGTDHILNDTMLKFWEIEN